MASPSWIGHKLNNRYEIIELLGQGGMSAVYKANDPNLQRIVAVKLIHPHLAADREFVRRFEAEAAAVAKLRHPHIIQVFDFNHHESNYYIVFEFIPGETLEERLIRLSTSGHSLPLDDVVSIVAKVADGLYYAHQKGLIHRDIKPANIMLNVNGEPIITDFGISKIVGGTQHTATGAVLGTAKYMAPEQIKGEKVDVRTDIYALGVTLYEMLTGTPPFMSDSAMSLMMMHVTDPVPNVRNLRPDVSHELVTVINQALAKEVENRYQSAKEFRKALVGAETQKNKSIDVQSRSSVTGTEVISVDDVIYEDSSASKYNKPIQTTTSRKQQLNWSLIAVGLVGSIIVVIAGVLLFGSGNEGDNLATIQVVAMETGTAKTIANIETSTTIPTATGTNLPIYTQTKTATPSETPTNISTPIPTKTPLPQSPPLSPEIGSRWQRPIDKMIMVYVPRGTFLMGSNPEQDPEAAEREQPQHAVTINSFWIDQTEVTNNQFGLFVDETGYVTTAESVGWGWQVVDNEWQQVDGADWLQPFGEDSEIDDQGDHPVVLVSWEDATSYCEWTGGQLPTEAQWEYAARGPESRIYPWGDSFDGEKANYCDRTCELNRRDPDIDDGYTQTAPVGSFSPVGDSWVEAVDLAGNVWEWVADWYGSTYYSDSPADNPAGPESGNAKVIRGGAWSQNYEPLRTAHRAAIMPNDRSANRGFRCTYPSNN